MRAILMTALLFLAGGFCKAQTVDTIGPGHTTLRTANLHPGLRQYFIYMQNPSDKRTLTFWYWLRRIDLTTVKGEPSLLITQHWYGQDTNMYREVRSVNKVSDFSPVYHAEAKGGKVFAYNWDDHKIAGADTVEGNAAKGFALDFSKPNLNWNLDIETFEMLPLAAGRAFAINFYDAGLDPPQYVVYTVTGSEVIQTLDGQHVDCWKLSTEGTVKTTHYTETYWISKADQEFLKEEDVYGATFRLKILMPATTPDPLQRFQAS